MSAATAILKLQRLEREQQGRTEDAAFLRWCIDNGLPPPPPGTAADVLAGLAASRERAQEPHHEEIASPELPSPEPRKALPAPRWEADRRTLADQMGAPPERVHTLHAEIAKDRDMPLDDFTEGLFDSSGHAQERPHADPERPERPPPARPSRARGSGRRLVDINAITRRNAARRYAW